MLAVDTNLILRYLLRDDETQARLAQKTIDGNKVFVPITVLIETEWALRRGYRLAQKIAADMIAKFAGLPTVTIENAAEVRTALEYVGHGLDFADALHLAKAQACQAFVTFDKDLGTKARRLGLKVRAP